MPSRVVTLVPGSPRRLDLDCPSCGWADLWEVTLHSLSPSGVSPFARLRQCQRCGTVERRSAR